MSLKELVAPLAVGVAAAALVALVMSLPSTPSPEDATPPDENQTALLFPFPEGPVASQPGGIVLALSAQAERPAQAHGHGLAEPANITWVGQRIGTLTVTDQTIYCIKAPCPQPAAPWILRHAMDDRRLDVQAHSPVLTFYGFDAEGLLLSSNAPGQERNAFALHPDFFSWNRDPWYFGDDQNKSGQRLPVGHEQARAALDGLAQGGVATMYLERHQYDWLVGPLWLTARVDGF